jgi:hypothetical protein
LAPPGVAEELFDA